MMSTDHEQRLLVADKGMVDVFLEEQQAFAIAASLALFLKLCFFEQKMNKK